MKSDVEMLRALYQAGAEGISGNFLAAKTGADQASIRSRIQEWRRLGFQIEVSPHFGYRLLEAPHRLLGEDIAARIGAVKVVGRQIQVFQETSSTNEVALRLAVDGVAEGAVVFAERQSRGRGRLGRAWFGSSGKSVLMSLLLRPALRPPEAARLTIIGAVAVARAVEKCTAVRPSIKWPNDLIVWEKKLAGILTENARRDGSNPPSRFGNWLECESNENGFSRRTATAVQLSSNSHRASVESVGGCGGIAQRTGSGLSTDEGRAVCEDRRRVAESMRHFGPSGCCAVREIHDSRAV